MLDRRDLLNLTVAAAAGTSTAAVADETPADGRDAPWIVDTNVSLFRWPFRRLPLDEVDKLVAKLRSLGIARAWAGSFEGLLHRDLAAVNHRLAEVCRQRPELAPIGSINPTLPGWERDLRQCIGEHGMLGIRLHPNYHDYSLDDARFASVLRLAADAGRLVQLTVAVEDTRTQHPRLRAADVDLTPLPDVLAQVPAARVQILGDRPRGAMLERLAAVPAVLWDTSRVDATDGVPRLVEHVGLERVLLGTHAPLLIPEAALIRTHESGRLDTEQLGAVLAGNARRLAVEARP